MFPHDRVQSRGAPLWAEFHTGNTPVSGEWLFVFDDHLDAQWSGPWNGTVYGEVECSGGTYVSWEGTFVGETPGYLTGLGGTVRVQARAGGRVEGMTIHFDIHNLAGVTFGIEGYILDPHGASADPHSPPRLFCPGCIG